MAATSTEKVKVAAEYEAVVGKRPRKGAAIWQMVATIESVKRIKAQR